jgi:hypothetical protein
MHSFQPSRGRIVFQVLCAIGVAASFGGAWLQTGASALLAASAIATLYGLVHFFDLFRRDLHGPRSRSGSISPPMARPTFRRSRLKRRRNRPSRTWSRHWPSTLD